uniref:LRR-RLK n=1 Tax=Rhizophora mucronata TaxID=61149 RepID=A0A2P2MD49_RHIMU
MCCSIYVCRVTERETKIATGKRSHSDFYFVLSCMPMECRFTRKHYCFWVLIHVAFVGVLESCLEEERLGLLSIKDHFKLYNGDASEFLPSWTDDPVADCCSWERVKCNNATMVTQLSLDELPLSPNDGQMVLNMSLFAPFKELLNLSLSHNDFTVCNQNYGK